MQRQGDVLVVDVEGQLIVGNRQELKQKVLDELERGERKFLIDFSKTGYIDSSGLGVLVSLSQEDPRAGRRAAARESERGSPDAVRAHASSTRCSRSPTRATRALESF